MPRLIDLTGKRFGKLLVLCQDKAGRRLPSGKKVTYWFCRCDCGNERGFRGDILKNGALNKSCGKCGSAFVYDETGKRYVKWLVIGRVPTPEGSYRATFYLCRCDCGIEKVIRGSELRNGNSQSCGCLQKLPEGWAARNSLLTSYKKHASIRNLCWEITPEQFFKLTKSKCFYCDCAPSQTHKYSKNSKYQYNGIDRLDSTAGYYPENVVACCKTCNFAKRTMTTKEFLSWIKRVYNHSVR
jgi:hypothetical protein